MAIRLTPGSPGGENSSRGARAAFGAFEGLSNIGAQMGESARRRRAADEGAQRTLFKDYADKVMKGDLEPDQAEQALTAQGVKVPKGYFHTLQPSVEGELQKVMGGIGKASSTQEVPGVTSLSATPALQRVKPKMGLFDSPSQPDATTGDPTLDSKQTRIFSPEFDQLLKVRDEKLDSFAPQQVASVDPKGNKQTEFVPSRPDKLVNRTFATEATPEQQGQRKATEAITEQRGKLSGGLPELQAEAFTRQETGERPAKVETAGQMARRTAQEGINVSTDPKNVAREARKAAAITDAQTRARMLAEQLPPDIANNVAQNLVMKTATNRPYAFIDPSMPKDIRDAAYKVLTAPSEASPRGIKIVTKDQAAALQAIDKARADYKALMGRLEGHLAKSAQGRPLSALNNKLSVYLQSDPELAAAMATGFPLIIQNLKANAGAVGRIMQREIEGMIKSVPLDTDTWRVARLKQAAEMDMFEHGENSILGHPDAK